MTRSNMQAFKDAIGRFLHRRGYHLQRLSRPGEPGPAFLQQAELCGKIERPVIFDGGAYHGEVTKIYRQLFPKAVIHAFEPFPESHAILKRNCSGDPDIHTPCLGLADKPGKRAFAINAFTATNSLLPTAPEATATWREGYFETKETRELDFTTIDAYVAEHGIGHIDILKLDLQGAEPLALQGAQETLSAGRIGLVFMEVLTTPVYQGQKKLHEMLALMETQGFELHDFYELSRKDDRLYQLDALFIRSRTP